LNNLLHVGDSFPVVSSILGIVKRPLNVQVNSVQSSGAKRLQLLPPSFGQGAEVMERTSNVAEWLSVFHESVALMVDGETSFLMSKMI
jgi:hypothetical protein